jgi:hypothetical protein
MRLAKASRLTKPKKPKIMLISLFWLGLFVGLIYMVRYTNEHNQEVVVAEVGDPWDPKLIECNKVEDATPSDALSACIEVAQDGWYNAMYRLVWAYNQPGEFFDWRASYYWAMALSEVDDYAEVFAQLLLFKNGESDTERLKGEKRIRQLASNNHHIASAYLASLYYLELNTLPKTERISWLLDRSYNENKHWVLPTDIATIYAKGYLGKKQPVKAKKVLLAAAELDFPHHANNIAWLMATTPIKELADYSTALNIALKVTEVEEYSIDYVYVDTLAAAYAAIGDYENAVETQKNAVELLKIEYENGGEGHPKISSFESRLSLFKQQKRFVDELPANDGKAFFTNFKDMIEADLGQSFFFEIEAPENPIVIEDEPTVEVESNNTQM